MFVDVPSSIDLTVNIHCVYYTIDSTEIANKDFFKEFNQVDVSYFADFSSIHLSFISGT